MSTSRIIQLDPLVSNQIAAGEVIERPASIIKELVENSLDAKATQIDIDIEGSGVHLIRIRDNGVGIDKADLPLAFARHATSKIRFSEDLFAIQSLGFRGEALASIAAVSRCRITSCAQGQSLAWQCDNTTFDGSALMPAAHEEGTTIEVSDLFYNVPVRRKFLRSAKTEFQSMDDMLKRLALSHPEVRFKLTHQQRLIRHYPAVSANISEDSRVAKIGGQSFIDHALKLETTAGDLCLHGWIGLPESAHRQADCQYVFINQRMIKDRFIHHIIKTLFQAHPDYAEGTYPCYVLYLSIDPTQIDVNVHPTKQEVRFHQPRWVHDFISKAVSDVLQTTVQRENKPFSSIIAAKRSVITPTISSAITPAMRPDIPTMRADNHRRYAFLEKDNGVYRIDMMRAKTGLLAAYCLQLHGAMPTKTRLFPEVITPLSPNADLSAIQTTLQEWGLIIQKQHHDWVLIQQPKCLPLLSSDQLLEIIKLCFKDETNTDIASYFAQWMSVDCLYDLSVRQFDALLSHWHDIEQCELPTVPII